MTNQAGPNRPSRPALRLLSLGAGVQSTAVLLLACEGAIPRFDYAVLLVKPQVLVAASVGSGQRLTSGLDVRELAVVGVAS